MWPLSRWTKYRYLPLSQASSWAPRDRPTSRYILIGFTVLYILTALCIRNSTRRDPTSLFFDPEEGYKPRYSDVRRHQAEKYIQALSQGTANVSTKYDPSLQNEALCLGIATVARRKTRYFRSTVGSVLEGLDPSERRRIHLILFIAHTDPSIHPAYSEHWMEKVADEVLLYNVADDQRDHLRELEQTTDSFIEKPLFDYGYLLEACLKTGAPYIAVLEDDVIAMDGWFHRTEAALAEAETETAQNHESSDFLYLRLFYTEKYFGWNNEEWPSYLRSSSFVLYAVAGALLAMRYYMPSAKGYLNTHLILTICAVYLPLCILLFFAAGRLTLFPLKPGVNEMNNFGCCSQGFVFQQSMAQNMVEYYSHRRVGFVDMLTEQYGDESGYPRLALTPSVLQHVGGRTSKDDGSPENTKGQRSEAETIWNFGFENFDAEELRQEHLMNIEKDGLS